MLCFPGVAPAVLLLQVRHPGVAHFIWQDFQLLRPLAAMTGRVRSLRVSRQQSGSRGSACLQHNCSTLPPFLAPPPAHSLRRRVSHPTAHPRPHPSAQSLNLSDSVSQFSHTMTAQTDLRVEAEHLRRFYNNFAAVGSSVRVPRPLEGGWVTTPRCH